MEPVDAVSRTRSGMAAALSWKSTDPPRGAARAVTRSDAPTTWPGVASVKGSAAERVKRGSSWSRATSLCYARVADAARELQDVDLRLGIFVDFHPRFGQISDLGPTRDGEAALVSFFTRSGIRTFSDTRCVTPAFRA
jgi:hypothetical protein